MTEYIIVARGGEYAISHDIDNAIRIAELLSREYANEYKASVVSQNPLRVIGEWKEGTRV